MTKEFRERFEKQFPRKRWITTLTIGGIHQLQEDVIAWHEQEIIEAERRGEARMKERCIEAFEPKKSEGDNWIYNMYSDTSVQKNIRSIK